MTPIRNQVLAKPFPSDEVSTGGIYVPESVREVSNKMKVVAAGKGTKDKPMAFKEGQTVFRVKDWGTGIMIGGELHFLIEDSALLAIQ